MTDKDVRDFAKQFAKGILSGRAPDMMCFMVSAPLASCLNVMGVTCEVVDGEINGRHHCWVRFADGRVIDATAKQFGLKNVWLQHSEIHK